MFRLYTKEFPELADEVDRLQRRNLPVPRSTWRCRLGKNFRPGA
jgi:hypothetical protein